MYPFLTQNSTLSNFSGATLTLNRNGGASAQDLFSATGTLSTLTQGGNLVVGGTTIGTVTTNSSGTLVLTFNSSATKTLVETAMRQIAYSNSSDAPTSSVQVNWTLNDGNTGAQGTGGAQSVTGSVTVNITAVNDAPVLTVVSPNLTSITETSNSAPSGAVGTLVTSLLDMATPSGGFDNVTDADGTSTLGIAVTSVDSNYGTWWYSTNAGTNWSLLGNVSSTNSLLLSADANTRVYFQINTATEYWGSMGNALNYRAWDQSTGSAGTYVSTLTNGGTSAFSSTIDSANLSVTAVNDAPRLLGTELVTNGTFNTNISGWTTSGTVALGSNALAFGSSNAVGPHTASQTITTVAGQTYELSFQYKDDSGARNQSLVVTANGSANLLTTPQLVTSVSGTSYVTYNYTFVADSSSTAITFTDTSDSSGLTTNGTTSVDSFVDNISVRQRDGNFGSLAYTENGGAQAVYSALSLNDFDSTNMTGATVQITSGYTSAQDTLSFTNQNGITGSWNSTNGTLTLSGTTTRANYELALQSITYTNSSDAPTSSRTVTFLVNDGTTNSTAATRDIAIANVNDAPVLTPYSPTLPLSENAGAYTATLSSLVGGSITDADSGAVKGIAITNLSLAGGTLEYSLDGTNWIAVSGVSSTNALLLRATDQMRFTPSTTNGGTTHITYNAWDQTSGSAGSFANVTSNGGTTAFSTAIDTITVNVSSVNDAPVLDNSGSMTLTAITEDDINNAGQSVASIILSAGGDRISDVDSSASEGIAITATTSGNGSWQYSTDGGTNWSSVGTVSGSSALLLRSTDLVRFVPNGQNATTGDITFRAWDQTSGTFGTKVNVSSNGGTTAFSAAIEVASITVTSLNDAPTFTPIGASAQSATISISADNSYNLYVNGVLVGGDTSWESIEAYTTTLQAGDVVAIEGIDTGGAAAMIAAIDFANGARAVSGTDWRISTSLQSGWNTQAFDDSQWQRATAHGDRTSAPWNTSLATDSDYGNLTTANWIWAADVNNVDQVFFRYVVSDVPTVNENSVAGTSVVRAVASDVDTGATLTYSILSQEYGGAFAIDANSGMITVANSSLLNFEVDASHTVTVQVSDGSLTHSNVVTINLTNVNETPTALADTATAVEAGGVANSTLGNNPTGNVLTNDTDIDSGDTKALSGVVAGTSASASGSVGAAVTGSYGSINIAANGAYTYTVYNSNATVQALRISGQTITDVFTYTMQDAGGLTSTTQITVTIQGANDAPTAVVDTVTAVEAGGTSNGTAGTNPTGNVLTNDTDADSSANGETQTVVGVLAGSQVSASGNVAASVTGTYGSINIAADGSYTYIVDNANTAVQALRTTSNTLTDVFTYTMTDATGIASTARVSVTVQGANDAPTDLVATTYLSTLTPTATNNTYSGVLNDIDHTTNPLVLDGVTFARGLGMHAPTSGVSTADYAITGATTFRATIGINDYTTGTYGTVVFRVYVDGNLHYTSSTLTSTSAPIDLAIDTTGGTTLRLEVDNAGNGNAADHAVWLNARLEGGTVALAIAENSSNGAIAGSVNRTDVDWGDNATYSLIDSAGGRFAVSSTTGLITVADGSLLNYEANTSHTIVVRATDAGGLFFNKSMIVTVGDINEAPVALSDSATAVEAGGLNNGTAGSNPTGNVLTNDTDIDAGDTKTVSGVVAGTSAIASGSVGTGVTGSFGSINIAANGSYTYTVDNTNATVQALRTSTDTLTDVYTYTMSDAGGLTSTTQLTVTLQGVNDAPNQSGIEATPLSYTENAGSVSITSTLTLVDVDDANLASATVQITGNYVSGQDLLTFTNQNGISGSWDSVTGTLTLTGAATKADYEAALRSVSYSNSSEIPNTATRTVSFTVSDGALQSTAVSRDISINSINDAPVNLIPGTLFTGVNNTLTLSGANAIQVSDVDAASSTIRVTLTASHGAMTLSSTIGLSFITGDGTSDANIVMTGTMASINAALDGMQFIPTNGYTGSASISFQTEDLGNTGTGGNLSDTDVIAIQVGGVRFQEGDNGYTGTQDTYVSSSATSTAHGNATSVLVDDPSQHGLIRFDNIFGSGAGQIAYGSTITSASMSIYVTGTDNLDLVNVHRMLSSWTEASTWNSLTSGVQANNVEAATSITYTVDAGVGGWITITGLTSTVQAWSDGATNNGWALLGDGADNWTFHSSEFATVALRPYLTVAFTSPQSADIDLDANNSSGVSGSGYTRSWTENAGAVAIADIDATVSDADSSNLQSMSVSISNLQDGAAELLAANTSGTSITASYNSGTGTLTLSGNDTVAHYQQVLRTVTYNNTSDSPSTSARLITVQTADAYVSSNLATATISIQAVNDAPVLDSTGNMSLTTITEDNLTSPGNSVASIVASAGGNRITDVDSGAVEGIAITALNSGNGTWQYSLDGSIWTNVGTVNNASALLLRSTDLVRFVPNGNNGTTGDITFRAWDQTSGSAGSKVNASTTGGSSAFSTATEIASIVVTSINDNPIANSDSATAVEAGGTNNSTAGSNPIGNVLTNDTDVDTGDTRTVTGVAAGVVGSASSSVGVSVVGSYGSVSVATNGAYSYTVDNSNANVQALRNSGQSITDVFTYTVTDAGGLTSTTQVTITIQGANDTPTITSDGGTSTAVISMAENVTAVTTVVGNDVDSGTTLVYSIIGGADAGKFSIGSFTGSLVFVTAPDFEVPTDVGGNNVYDVTIQVNDGFLTTTQAIAVTITDVSNFLIVTTATDNNDSSIATGASYNIEWLNANRGADASVSLREAIIAANNTTGTDTVNFNISGTGAHTINVASALPTITEAVILDATSDDSFSANGNRPAIILDGNDVVSDGLVITSTAYGSTIRGFIIRDFDGHGISIYSGSSGNTIEGNYVGSVRC